MVILKDIKKKLLIKVKKYSQEVRIFASSEDAVNYAEYNDIDCYKIIPINFSEDDLIKGI